MKIQKLFLVLVLSLSLQAGNLQLKEGFVAAHTQTMIGDIDLFNNSLQADVNIQKDDITSLKGKFWIEMKLFSSDNSDRDDNMYESLNIQEHPLATYTLTKVTKIQGDDTYELQGSLNFFGHDKPFKARSEIVIDKGVLTLKATSMIRMSDYTLEVPCMLFICVQDEVDLFIKATLVQ